MALDTLCDKMKVLSKRTVSILAFSLTAFNSHGQNLIDLTYGVGAGDFEVGAFTENGLPAGSTNLVGWVVDTNSIDWISTGFANTSSGMLAIDLNGSSPGAIHTVVPTIPGEIYEVAYDVAAFVHFTSPSSPKRAEVSAGFVTNIVVLTGPTIDAAPIALSWTREQLRFTALSSNSTITFKSLMPTDASGVLLDNVSVTHVVACTPVTNTVVLTNTVVVTEFVTNVVTQFFTNIITQFVTNTVSLGTLRADVASSSVAFRTTRQLTREIQQVEKHLQRLGNLTLRRIGPVDNELAEKIRLEIEVLLIGADQ